MHIAWTTVASRDEAHRIADDVVTHRLAACVQIDGPISSYYQWEGKMACDEEYRLTFKCLPEQLPGLEAHVSRIHPYATPQWIVVTAAHVAEKYLSWARTTSSTPPL